MLEKLKILDEALDKLDEINRNRFLFEKFKEINSEIEKILLEIKSNQSHEEINKFSEEHITIFKNLLNKIDKLELKILPKATLLETFSMSSR
tara:strand:- start:1099 stop:1374 length:276 start_codon:yes stop_codon:yes gene_type:complete